MTYLINKCKNLIKKSGLVDLKATKYINDMTDISPKHQINMQCTCQTYDLFNSIKVNKSVTL